MAREYMFRRWGAEHVNIQQLEDATTAYTSKGLLRPGAKMWDAFVVDGDFDKQYCIMTESVLANQIDACIAALEQKREEQFVPFLQK